MALDSNSDGILTAKEMKEGMAKAGLNDIPPDLKQILEDVDSDGSGQIDYTEFLAATLDKREYAVENVLWGAFRVFDLNGDGKLSKEELEKMLKSDDAVGSVLAGKDVSSIMKEIDTDGSGEIDFQEFMNMMRDDKQ